MWGSTNFHKTTRYSFFCSLLRACSSFKQLFQLQLSPNHVMLQVKIMNIFVLVEGYSDLDWASTLEIVSRKEISVDFGMSSVPPNPRIYCGLVPLGHIGLSSCNLGSFMLQVSPMHRFNPESNSCLETLVKFILNAESGDCCHHLECLMIHSKEARKAVGLAVWPRTW